MRRRARALGTMMRVGAGLGVWWACSLGAGCGQEPPPAPPARPTQSDARAAQRDGARAELKRAQADLEAVTPKLPGDFDAAATLERLDVWAKLSGVDVARVVPQAARDAGALRVVPVQVELSGGYGALMDFAQHVERGERLMRLSALDMTREATGTLRVKLNVEVLYAEPDDALPDDASPDALRSAAARVTARHTQATQAARSRERVTPVLAALADALSPPRDARDAEAYTRRGWHADWAANRAWLESVKARGDGYTLQGGARDQGDLAELLQRLKSLDAFGAASLKRSEQVKGAGASAALGEHVRFTLELETRGGHTPQEGR